jgi:hypothetical protein
MAGTRKLDLRQPSKPGISRMAGAGRVAWRASECPKRLVAVSRLRSMMMNHSCPKQIMTLSHPKV